MNIFLSNLSGKSLYEQIYEQIKMQILEGTLKEGEALPTIRGLAKDLKISVITTARAYSDLERDGFIYSVVGKGSFVSSADEVTRSLQKKIIERFEGICTQCRKVGVKKPELLTVLDQVYAQKENGI